MILLEQLINKWNEERKCGKCWKLVRTFNDHLKGVTNLYNPNRDEGCCCTHIFLEGLRIKTGKHYNEKFGSIEKQWCDYFLHLRIAEVSDFGKSKADEYGCDDNIYDNHIKSLIDCLACSFESDLCSINPLAEIHDEETEPFFSFGDVNWAGIDYKLKIRIYKDA